MGKVVKSNVYFVIIGRNDDIVCNLGQNVF